MSGLWFKDHEQKQPPPARFLITGHNCTGLSTAGASLVRIEAASVPGHGGYHRGRRVTTAQAGLEVLERACYCAEAKVVHIVKGSPPERGKANAEHRTDIAVTRAADNPLVQTARSLVEHRQECALDDRRISHCLV